MIKGGKITTIVGASVGLFFALFALIDALVATAINALAIINLIITIVIVAIMILSIVFVCKKSKMKKAFIMSTITATILIAWSLVIAIIGAGIAGGIIIFIFGAIIYGTWLIGGAIGWAGMNK